jgi:hypothetical protein
MPNIFIYELQIQRIESKHSIFEICQPIVFEISRCVHLYVSYLYVSYSSFFFACKDKPGVAEKVMARTNNFVCPLTDRKMYEDLSYASEKIDRTSTSSKRSHIAEQEQEHKAKKVKAAKVIKDKAAAKVIKDETADKPFSPAQLKQLGKLKSMYDKVVEQFAEMAEHIKVEGLAAYMAPHLLSKLSSHMLELDSNIAELDINIQAAAGEFSVLKNKAAADKASSSGLRQRIATMTEEAEEAKKEFTSGSVPLEPEQAALGGA